MRRVAVRPTFVSPLQMPSIDSHEDLLDELVEHFLDELKTLTRKRSIVVATGRFHDSQYDITIARRALISETEIDYGYIKPGDLVVEMVFELFEQLLYITYIHFPEKFGDYEQFRYVLLRFARESGAPHIISSHDGVLQGIFPPEELMYVQPKALESIDPDRISIVYRGQYFEMRYDGMPFYIFYPVLAPDFRKMMGRFFQPKDNKVINFKWSKLQKVSPSKERELMVQARPSLLSHYDVDNQEMVGQIHSIAIDVITNILEEVTFPD